MKHLCQKCGLMVRQTKRGEWYRHYPAYGLACCPNSGQRAPTPNAPTPPPIFFRLTVMVSGGNEGNANIINALADQARLALADATGYRLVKTSEERVFGITSNKSPDFPKQIVQT